MFRGILTFFFKLSTYIGRIWHMVYGKQCRKSFEECLRCLTFHASIPMNVDRNLDNHFRLTGLF